MSLENIKRLQDNLSELQAALFSSEASVDYLPIEIVSAGRICNGRSWKLWIDHLFGKKLPDQKHLEVVRSTLQDLFKSCVQDHAYRAYHRRVASWINQIKGTVSVDRDPAAILQGQKDRYRQYIIAAFGSTQAAQNLPEITKFTEDFSENILKTVLLPGQVDDVREVMAACSQATKPFWQLCLKPPTPSLIAPIKHLVPDSSALIYKNVFYQAFKRAQCLLDLEGILEEDIPITLLAKLNSPNGLSDSENKQLQQWIKKLNQYKAKINPSAFELALNEIVEIINIEGHYSTTVDDLILKLDEIGCQIIQQDDPAFVRWKDSLKTGDDIVCNGKRLKLGVELIRNEEADEDAEEMNSDDSCRIFTLVGPEHTRRVVKIANNRFKLKVEATKAKQEKWHWGIRPTEIISNISSINEEPTYGLDKFGICVVLERLQGSLENIEWSSRNLQLAAEDKHKALVLANHLYCMQEWHAMPENLHPKNLMFDGQGVLKILRLSKKVAFNYNTLEHFCILISKDNPYILRFLMRISQLIHHCVAKFYREAVSYTLKTGKTDLIARQLPKKHLLPDYREQVEKLCKRAKHIREFCFKKIKSELRKQNVASQAQDSDDEIDEEEEDKKLMNKIGERLAKIYEMSPTPGRLKLKEMRKGVIQSFLDRDKEMHLNNAIRMQTDVAIVDYYQSMFDSMMQYNRAAQ